MPKHRSRKRKFIDSLTRSKRIIRDRSYLKLLTDTEIKRFKKKYNYADSTLKKGWVSQRLNSRAREYYMIQYGRKNARKIAKKTGQSEKQLRRGRISNKARRIIESQIEVPFYFTRKISRIDWDFDSEYPENSIRNISKEGIRFIRGKRFWIGFDMTIYIGRDRHTRFFYIPTVYCQKNFTWKWLYNHIINSIITSYDKISEEYNLYMLTGSIEFQGELYDFPWINEMSIFSYKMSK